ncbi:MAG TPA: heptaprenyl diphosphate synthase [Syntrophomonadaceae bacterium]|nr:heptaprenyl diphosphate synthase [Syntrophomonadaceae bacterium]
MAYREILKEIKTELDYVENELKKYSYSSDTILGESSGHLLRAGGKRLRPAFVILAAKFFNYYIERIAPLAVAIELIHMASLVHDDVIDGSPTRRGIPTVSAKWGDAIALFTGDYLLAQALIIVARHTNEEIARLLARVSLQMCEGEIEQIETAGKIDQGLRIYLRRIKRKTALLFSTCCFTGALAGEAPSGLARCLKRYGYYVGMAFQITDDVLDFEGSEKVFGKPVGSDLRQGIITLPVYYTLRNRETGCRLANILAKEEKQESDWEEAMALVRRSGSLNLARNCSIRYLEKAKRELLALPDLPPRRVLAAITDFVIKRDF